MSWNLLDWPRIFFVVCFILLWLSARAGLYLRKRRGAIGKDEREELNLVLTSALTLLALIIGFTFSMAVGRYDLRKGNESIEANAISTEYLRAGILGAPDAPHLRSLLRQHIRQRIAAYQAGNESLETIYASTNATERAMWSIVERAGAARPDSIRAQIVSGMNDVIDAEASATAAWRNRIPVEGWVLMLAIAACCCALIGFDTKLSFGGLRGYMILPLLISISFFLIADLDSVHGGMIRVTPDDLIAAAQTMKG